MKSTSFAFLLALSALSSAGCTLSRTACIMSARDAVPAYRLPAEFRSCGREQLVPIDFNLLGQKRPEDGHRVDEGDLLGVYVGGVLPVRVEDQAIVQPPLNMAGNIYYPAYGRLNSPAVGVPIDVRTNGTIRLPLVGKLDVADKTLDEATEIVRTAYEEAGLIQKDRERVLLSLLRPRVHRVVVLREDAQAPMPQFLAKPVVPYTKIGRGEVIDLPVYENDVLHALAATGGLPGVDVFSEVWIFRSREVEGIEPAALEQQIKDAGSSKKFAAKWTQEERQLVRIPLRVNPGEPLPFSEEDMLLEDGDIIYLPPRETEVFYTGGQLPGGRVPLPRNQDVDVIEAIALINGSAGGPSAAGIFRTGPGNVYPPTQVLIIRKLPNGQQLRIRVNLNQAMHDPNERILIMPDDQLLLFFTPGELYSNLLLNFVGVGFTFVPNLNN